MHALDPERMARFTARRTSLASRTHAYAEYFCCWGQIRAHDLVRRQGKTVWLPLEHAVAINDSGYIVGAGAGGAVLLVPTIGPPAGLAFTVANGVVTLSWQPTEGALDYIVEAGSAPGAADLYNASVGAHPRLVTAAPPGRYYVRVRARTPTGVTAPSEEVVIDVP
jgi:hypothetical protein